MPTYTLTTLASFNGADGANPFGQVVVDSAGDVYGTTSAGGSASDGTVFELTQGTSLPQTRETFTNAEDPAAGLVADSAGNLFGTTQGGGSAGDGTVFEIVASSGAFVTLASVSSVNGDLPEGSLIADSSGNLYGTTENGGPAGDGLVFEYVKSTGVLQVLAGFDGANGAHPIGSLAIDSAGNLYGTTSAGGSASNGTAFEIARGSGVIQTLATFTGANGADSTGGLIIDSAGNLYGTTDQGGTTQGGTTGYGTVFEIVKSTGALQTLATFDNTGGENPLAGLLLDPVGSLYGTTQGGGSAGDGTVFEIVHSTGALQTLASFAGANGAVPRGSLTFDSVGDLFGTTYRGGSADDGTIYELSPTAAEPTITGVQTATQATISETPVTPFSTVTVSDSSNNGGANSDTLTIAQTGPGTLSGTGLVNSGSGSYTLTGPVATITQNLDALVFTPVNGVPNTTVTTSFTLKVADYVVGTSSPASAAITVTDTDPAVAPAITRTPIPSYLKTRLITFISTNGANPGSGLIADSVGNLYGTTTNLYGTNTQGHGGIFEIVKNSGTLETLAATPGDSHGNLIIDSAGNLYGTTAGGGAFGNGTIFEYSKSSGTVQVLASFTGTPGGAQPYCNLVTDSAGNFYGTTRAGGASNDGTIFEFERSSGTLLTLATFTGTANGADPIGGLLIDDAGNLYGTAHTGGTGPDPVGDGTVFEYVKSGGALQTLASFDGDNNGRFPLGGLVADSAGNLYGTTSSGGTYGNGTVFEIVKSSGALQTIHTFGRNEGGGSEASLTFDAAGDIYGTTSSTVFEIVKSTGVLQTLASFTGTPDGSGPISTILADGAGNLFGTTAFGGYAPPPRAPGDMQPGYGTVFELSPQVAPLTTTSEAAVTPFAGVTISDANGDATDTLTITVGGSGGTLTGAGLSGGSNGVYTLTGTAAAITQNLDALSFTPTAGQPNTSSTSTFALRDTSTASTVPATDSLTSVVDGDPAVSPKIVGVQTAPQTTTSEAPLRPFSTVTVSDANNGGTNIDTLTIAQSGTGILSGMGLADTGTGTYKLTGTAATITQELEALMFTPVSSVPNAAVTTSFTLQVGDTIAGMISATSAAVTVADRNSGQLRAAHDFNADNTSDVLLRAGGTLIDYQLSNGIVQVGKLLTQGVAGYTVAGVGDFNADGTADVILQNGGTLIDYLLQNGSVLSGGVIAQSLTGYTVAGIGDFNGDSTSDILLQNGGTLVDYQMQNGAVQTGKVVATGLTGYTVAGIGDFNGDGTSDILLQNGGTLVDYQMQNGAVQVGKLVATGLTGYSVAGIGDFNGDHTSDILLQNGGTLVEYFMSNGAVGSGNLLAADGSSHGVAGYNVVGTGDYDGNGVSDVLLQSGGTLVDYLLNTAGSLQTTNVVATGLTGYTVS